jgi:UTP--glucose-1-phosphate uridylyltransferase
MKLLDRLFTSQRHGAPDRVRALPRRVRKAVLPVAGLGTAFLPITKALPKEMLPIIDRPLIQYAVDEALAAGIRDLILVTHRSKRAIEDYFDRAIEIERELERRGRHRELSALRGHVSEPLHIAYARQAAPLGLGHAIHSARHLIGDQPFAVILPDDLLDPGATLLGEMTDRYQRTGCSVVAVQSVPRNEASRYGIVEVSAGGPARGHITGIAEKPPAQSAPSQLAAVGRYIFTPTILECLDGLQPGAHNEIQLMDGIARLLGREPVGAYEFRGARYDCGTRMGFLRATLAFASKHPELGSEFSAHVGEFAGQLLSSGVASPPAAPERLPTPATRLTVVSR